MSKGKPRLTSAERDRQLAALAAVEERGVAIDTADPETPETDFSKGQRGRFFRPVKEQITVRLDADILDWFKRHPVEGRGYQTHINAALRAYVERRKQLADS